MDEDSIQLSQRMFKHACAFCDCARNCEIEPNNIEYRMRSHTVAGLVNSAFACEVFIKSLLVYHGETFEEIKGHELKVLWDKFREKDNNTTSIVGQNMQEWFESEDVNMFDRLLNEASNAFEYWRYIYEKESGNINLNFLRGFRVILREICCKQVFKMSWEDYKNKKME